MGNKEVKKITLHCSAVGNLSPAILGCEKCEDCQHDFDFRDSGGCSGVVLTGARENVAAAVNRPGIFFDDVVIVNAEYYQLMIVPVPGVTYAETDELSETSRGTGGYGSTGR